MSFFGPLSATPVYRCVSIEAVARDAKYVDELHMEHISNNYIWSICVTIILLYICHQLGLVLLLEAYQKPKRRQEHKSQF